MADTAAGDDSFATFVSSLASLAQLVQASIKLIDSAIARQTIYDDTDASNVVVLDDVTPQYLKASHALTSCSASLDAALKSPGRRSAPVRRDTRLLVAARAGCPASQISTGPHEW
jgi:hypothetical protein